MNTMDYCEVSDKQGRGSCDLRATATDRASTTGNPATDLARTQVIHLGRNARNDQVVLELDHEALELIHPGRRRVVLDLAAVEEADTRLVAVLVKALRRARSAQVLLELLVSAHVRAWLSLYRADGMFQVRLSR